MSDGLQITTLLEEWVSNLPPKQYKHLSPSSLGGCPRVHYYKIKGVKQTTPPSAKALLNFQVGFLWEKLWENALEWSGTDYQIQVPFYDSGLNLGGTCDFLVKNNDQWEIWDSKTQNSKWFWYIQNQIRSGKYDELKEEHDYIIQQACYIILANLNGYDVKEAKLAYISKNDGYVGKITTVQLTPDIVTEVTDRCKYMNHCLENNISPDCECKDWKVGYCCYGVPESRYKSKTGKIINKECCEAL
jgi:hypothetical protein